MSGRQHRLAASPPQPTHARGQRPSSPTPSTSNPGSPRPARPSPGRPRPGSSQAAIPQPSGRRTRGSPSSNTPASDPRRSNRHARRPQAGDPPADQVAVADGLPSSPNPGSRDQGGLDPEPLNVRCPDTTSPRPNTNRPSRPDRGHPHTGQPPAGKPRRSPPALDRGESEAGRLEAIEAGRSAPDRVPDATIRRGCPRGPPLRQGPIRGRVSAPASRSGAPGFRALGPTRPGTASAFSRRRRCTRRPSGRHSARRWQHPGTATKRARRVPLVRSCTRLRHVRDCCGFLTQPCQSVRLELGIGTPAVVRRIRTKSVA